MSSRSDSLCSVEDDGVAGGFAEDSGLEEGFAAEVDGAAEEGGELFFEIEPMEAGVMAGGELDVEVEVGRRMGFGTGDGAEEGQFRDVVAAAEVGKLGGGR